MKRYIVSGLIAIALILSGCNSGQKNSSKDSNTAAHAHDHEGHDHDHDHEGHDHDKDDHDHDDHEGHDHGKDSDSGGKAESGGEHFDEIIFSKAQAQAVGLQVITIEPSTFSEVIKTSGQIQSAQGDEATIVATSNGIVSFVNPSISEGAAVKQGEALVTISAKNLLEGDPSVKAKMAYETATKEYERAEGLVKDQIISAKEFEQIKLRYETAKTVYGAQAKNVTANGVRVTSPISGYIKNRLVNQGEYVSVGQAIATVSQNKKLQLRAEVSEKYFKNLRNIKSANFKMAYDNTVYKLADLNGRLLSFGKTSNEQSFYIPVTFEFDNVGDIIPGSFTEVYLLSAPQNNVIAVPTASVTEEQGLHFVYLQLSDEEFKKQEVTLGANDGDRVVIVAGLKSGDKVVTKGVYQVKLAANSSVIPEGHSHSH